VSEAADRGALAQCQRAGRASNRRLRTAWTTHQCRAVDCHHAEQRTAGL